MLPQSSDPPIPMLRGVFIAASAAINVGTRDMVASPALLLAPSAYSQKVDGSARHISLLVDQQPRVDHRITRLVRDHRSPEGDLARRLGGRAGEAEGSAYGRSGRRAECDREGRPARRRRCLEPRTRSQCRTQPSRRCGPAGRRSGRAGGTCGEGHGGPGRRLSLGGLLTCRACWPLGLAHLRGPPAPGALRTCRARTWAPYLLGPPAP